MQWILFTVCLLMLRGSLFGFVKDDVVTLQRDAPIYFRDTLSRKGIRGEKIVVYSHDIAKHKVYFLTETSIGKTVAYNVNDHFVAKDVPTPTTSNRIASQPATQQPPTLDELTSVSKNNPLLVGGVILIVACVIMIPLIGRFNRYSTLAKHKRDAEAYVKLAKASGGLPIVATDLLLKDGEAAFYDCASTLYETRAVRHYQSGRVGFRVAKGLWIGGSKGYATSSQEWTTIDSGSFTITSKRIVFNGGAENRSFALSKVLGVDTWRDAVEIGIESRQKSLVFSAPNPVIAAIIIEMLCGQQS